jgi:hypothetical protein
LNFAVANCTKMHKGAWPSMGHFTTVADSFGIEIDVRLFFS